MVPVVPKLYQATVALRAHVMGHAGVSKTFDWIRRRFWWPGYYTQIRQTVLECTCCQSVANPKGASVIEGRILPRCEFDIIGMDLVKLPKSTEGFRYVLVALDHFTRYAWAVPIRRKNASQVMAAWLQIAMPTAKPRILLSDNGRVQKLPV